MRRAGVVTLLLCLASATAWAQPRDKKAADALFKEGRTAFDKGDFPTACAKFEASQKADPAAGTLLNLAVCEEKIGKLIAAKQHLGELVPQLGPKDDRIPFAKDLTQKLEQRIPTLTLTLAPGAPPDTAAKEAGAEAPLGLGTPLPFDPGAHDIVITASGRPDGHLQVNLVEGARESRAIAPGMAAVVVAPVAPVVDDGENGRKLRRTLGFVAGGVGIAGIGVAAVTGIVLVSKKSDLDKHCPNKNCDPTGVKLLADAKSTPLVAINMVGWVTGLVGLGAGATLILTSRAPAAKDTAASARLSPVAAPGFGGLSLDGRF